MAKKLKLPIYLVLTIFLTLGLSISLQSLLAAWTPPTANPAGSNVKMPIYNANTSANPRVNSDLTILTDADDAGFFVGVKALSVYSDTNQVGVGTSNPLEKLHQHAAGDNFHYFTNDNGGKMKVGIGAGHAAWLMQEYDDYMVIGTNNTERIRIDNNGNVGIGTENPAYKLDVSGDAKISGEVSANSFMYSSDLRLKDNIEELENPLDKILNMRGVSFEFKGENEKKAGFIAQEVEKIIPEIVDTNETTGLKSVEYGNLNAYLVEAIKELNKEIKVLNKEIDVLKKGASF